MDHWITKILQNAFQEILQDFILYYRKWGPVSNIRYDILKIVSLQIINGRNDKIPILRIKTNESGEEAKLRNKLIQILELDEK